MALAPLAARAEYKRVHAGEDRDLYVDGDDISIQGESVTAWTRFNFKRVRSEDGIAFNSEDWKLEVKCRRRMTRALHGVRFYDTTQIKTYSGEPGDLEPIVPGTYMGAIADYFCRFKNAQDDADAAAAAADADAAELAQDAAETAAQAERAKKKSNAAKTKPGDWNGFDIPKKKKTTQV